MSARVFRIGTLLLLVLSLSTAAAAQVQTGSIFVRAVDEDRK